MASRFWVTGGNGNWSSTTNWSATTGGASGSSAPGSADTATFNASSGSGTATVDSSVTIQTLTCTGFTGTLAFGTNTISVNSTGTVFTGDTTMTVTGTPLIILTNSSATARALQPGTVTEANSISFRVTAGTGSLALGTAPSYRDLDFTDGVNPTGFAGTLGTTPPTIYGNFKASTGMTAGASANPITFAATSGTKTINTAGVTFDRSFTFNGVGGTWQLQAALTSSATRTITLTNGTLDLNGYTVTYGGFSSNNSNTRTLAFGSSGKLILSGSGATIFAGNTSTGASVTGTAPLVQFNYSGGTGQRNIVMWSLPESQAISVEILNNATDIVVLQGATAGYKNIDVTNFNGTLQFANTPRCFGNLTLGSSLSSAVTGSTLTFAATSGTKTITLAGQTIDEPLAFNGVGGTWQLQDNFTQGSTRTLTLTNGTIDLNGKTFSTGTLQTAAGTKNITFNGGSLVITSSGTTAFNNAVPTGFTTTAGTETGTISMNSASAKTFVGGGSTFNCSLNQGGAGALSISGVNTFNNITNTYSATGATSILLQGTQTVSAFSATGSSGKLLTINSNTAGTQRTITLTGGGTIFSNYLDVKDISFTPFSTDGTAPYKWYAGANSTNSGNNSGILFAAATVTAYLLLSGTSWTTPANWNNASNTIHMIGGGGGGAGNSAGDATNNRIGGAGGGGGGYTQLTNQTLSGAISYAIGSAGSAGTGGPASSGGTGGTTTFNTVNTAGGGQGGQVTTGASPTATGGTGGTGTTNNGGAAGDGVAYGTTTNAASAGGGGGAGGPNGVGGKGGNGGTDVTTAGAGTGQGGGGGNGGGSAGANGTSAAATGTGGNGGNNFGGTGGGIGAAGVAGTAGTVGGGGGGSGGLTAGGAGGAGIGFSNTVGGGGGSGGNGPTSTAPTQTGYGSGGGGTAIQSTGTLANGGAGAQGMIFIIYTPSSIASTSNFFMMFN